MCHVCRSRAYPALVRKRDYPQNVDSSNFEPQQHQAGQGLVSLSPAFFWLVVARLRVRAQVFATLASVGSPGLSLIGSSVHVSR